MVVNGSYLSLSPVSTSPLDRTFYSGCSGLSELPDTAVPRQEGFFYSQTDRDLQDSCRSLLGSKGVICPHLLAGTVPVRGTCSLQSGGTSHHWGGAAQEPCVGPGLQTDSLGLAYGYLLFGRTSEREGVVFSLYNSLERHAYP